MFSPLCVRGGGLVHWLNNERSSINATKTDDTTSYVMVDEIWNETEGYFNANTLSSLLQYITGNEDITASDVVNQGSIGQTKTSADIRDIQLNAGNTYQYTDEDTQETITTGKDVQVTFGGLTWQVVHLTQDRSKNDIVTLWLSNNKQDAWEGREANEGEHYGFIDGALYSNWSNNFYNASFTVTYPSSLYGASYIHAVTLNNGGKYATSTSAVTSQPAQQDSNSVFALFTMEEVAGNVTEYLVTPRQVAYQETENVNTQYGWANYYPNEAYGEPNGSGSWNPSNGGAVNITTNQYYDAWADDTLWLPSLTETGYDTGYEGLWDTSTSQRASNIGSDLNTIMGEVGSTSGAAYNRSWLRSGGNLFAYFTCNLYASGSGYGGDGFVDRSLAVRPALHLNLNSAAENAVEAAKRIWDGTSTEAPTLQNPAQANSEDNPYIIDSAAKLAWISANFDQPNCYGQHYLQTVDIDLASHPWTPINNVADTTTRNRRAYYYDGGNHTISNLYINTSEQTLASSSFIGLFGYVYGSSSNHAYIKNLGIVNGSITGEGSRYVGAVVGYSYYTDITNCYNAKTDITITGSSQSVGGVAGYNRNGTISSSYNTGAVSGNYYVGGVAGSNDRGTIRGSYNDGDITGSLNLVGGVVGYNSNGTISGSYNTGAVSGVEQVGGVAGYNSGTISGSYNTGAVSGSNIIVGGVAGGNSGTISGSYNTGTVSGRSAVGGVVGNNDRGTISGSYNTGTVSGSREVGGVAGYVNGSSSSSAVISSCFSIGAVTRTSGSSTYFGGVVGYIDNSTSYPSRYVSISWCYYNTETVGSVVTKAIGYGNGYQVYGLTTAQMQGDKNQNYMYLSDTFWNFASGEYPTLKYVGE